MPADIKVVSFQNNGCVKTVDRCVQDAPKALTIMDIFAMKLEVFKATLKIVEDRKSHIELSEKNSKLVTDILGPLKTENVELQNSLKSEGVIELIESKKKELRINEAKLNDARRKQEDYAKKITALETTIRRQVEQIAKVQAELKGVSPLDALAERTKPLTTSEERKIKAEMVLIREELKKVTLEDLRKQGQELLVLSEMILKVGRPLPR
jgi:hypothetical protein